MKVIYFGSDVFLTCFDFFLRYHEIIALYTYHHDEDYMTEEGIVRKAKAHGIPVHYESITAEEAEAGFDSLELVYPGEIPVFEKYDEFVPPELVRKGFAYGVLDIEGMKKRVRQWSR